MDRKLSSPVTRFDNLPTHAVPARPGKRLLRGMLGHSASADAAQSGPAAGCRELRWVIDHSRRYNRPRRGQRSAQPPRVQRARVAVPAYNGICVPYPHTLPELCTPQSDLYDLGLATVQPPLSFYFTIQLPSLQPQPRRSIRPKVVLQTDTHRSRLLKARGQSERR